jgi:transcription termination factor Rho
MPLRAQAHAASHQIILMSDVPATDGTLEIMPDGSAFLRRPEANYLPTPGDVRVPVPLLRQHRLRFGMTVGGPLSLQADGDHNGELLAVDTVDGLEPDQRSCCITFEERRPVHPHERLALSAEPAELNMRVVDLLTPIGKGQRGLIVAPPRTGKTVLLAGIARSLKLNHPECQLFVLLVDERPEEVTDLRRTIAGPAAEVISSTFDRPAHEHIRLAEIVLARAKRLTEAGRDAVILLDSLTRLARAHNTIAPPGKLMTGGIVAGALDRPKRFFGAARATEEGGSLTILATALIDTGSRMDEVIFEEFKGTGNMELHLDRRLVDKRVWPAIDINRSSTRREELLVQPSDLERMALLRRVLSPMNPIEAMQCLTSRLAKTSSNAEFLSGRWVR